MYTVMVNSERFDFREERDMVVYLLQLTTKHILYSPLPILKDNIVEMCNLISEIATPLMKRKINAIKKFVVYKKTNEAIQSMLFDSILAIEGHGLLPGFQYGSKIHKNDKPQGNAEKTSILSKF